MDSSQWQALIGGLLLLIVSDFAQFFQKSQPATIAIGNGSFMIYCFFTCSKARTPFISISVARCVSHILSTCIYGYYYAVRLFCSLTNITWTNPYIDTLSVGFWFVLAPTEFLLGLNRIVAINLPFKYPDIFSAKLTMVYILCSWISAIIFYIYHVIVCPISFSSRSFEVEYTSQQCLMGDALVSEVFVYPCMGLSFIMAITAFAQNLYRTKSQRSTSSTKRWLLFAQAPAQILCWLLATSIWVSNFRSISNNRLFLLLSLPFAQSVAHALETIIIVSFHMAYRKHLAD